MFGILRSTNEKVMSELFVAYFFIGARLINNFKNARPNLRTNIGEAAISFECLND